MRNLVNESEFLWVEKYRPNCIDDCILPTSLKETFTSFIKEGIPNLLLSGGPGVGKTTVARAMLEQCHLDYKIIIGSMNGNIDTLRTDIKNYASTISLMGTRKYVILDEADYLNTNTTQPALRGFIEEYSKNCGFILTCNFKNRILPALQSRCSNITFDIPSKDRPRLAQEFMKRAIDILDSENVEYEEKVLAELIRRNFPDWRRILNELQRYSSSGKIDVGVLSVHREQSLKELSSFLKKKTFAEMRKWVVNNIDNDVSLFFRKLYDTISLDMKAQSVPQLVLILADYQYKAAFVADQEVNVVACLTEIMANCEFK